MRIPGSRRLKQAIARTQKHFSSTAAILIYHRIANVEMDPWSLAVTPQNFAEQLAVIQEHANPISLAELAQAQRSGNIPDRAVVITFDDGYVDNFHHAKPLLERHGIPATVFISTGYLGETREFWWDELEGLLLKPGTLGDQLSLVINGHSHQWTLGQASHYNQADYQQDCTRTPDDATPGSRLAFFYAVWQQLQPLPEQERLRVLSQLRAWVKSAPSPRPSYRPMTREELVAFGAR
jgi:hypothetical protein